MNVDRGEKGTQCHIGCFLFQATGALGHYLHQTLPATKLEAKCKAVVLR